MILQGDIRDVLQVVDTELDWFIASCNEKNKKRKIFARTMFFEKRKDRAKLAKEMHEKYS